MARTLSGIPGLLRGFERSNREKSWELRKAAGDRSPQRNDNHYARLLRVQVRHDYYNTSEWRPQGVEFAPTPTTAELLHSLGMVFRNEESGFSIFYPAGPARSEGLLGFLRRQGRCPDGTKSCSDRLKRVWTRLSLVMRSGNPYFVGISDIPIDTDPGQENFYFSNRSAHRRPGEEALLMTGPRVNASELRSTVPLQVAVPVDDRTREIRIQDVSGEPVMCRPRCFPKDRRGRGGKPLPASPTAVDCGDLAPGSCGEPDSPLCNCMSTLYLDFATLPEGLYHAERVPYGEKPVGAEEGLTMLHTSSSPLPIAFLDLFFTDPSGADGPLFPVRGLYGDGGGSIEEVAYQLVFAARRTHWRYFIVSQDGGELPSDLAITCLEPPGEACFDGPHPVVLPSATGRGTPAACFVSRRPLELMERSRYRFQLFGRKEADASPELLVPRLPVPSMQQVTPGRRAPREGRDRECVAPGPGAKTYSDLYVHV